MHVSVEFSVLYNSSLPVLQLYSFVDMQFYSFTVCMTSTYVVLYTYHGFRGIFGAESQRFCSREHRMFSLRRLRNESSTHRAMGRGCVCRQAAGLATVGSPRFPNCSPLYYHLGDYIRICVSHWFYNVS